MTEMNKLKKAEDQADAAKRVQMRNSVDMTALQESEENTNTMRRSLRITYDADSDKFVHEVTGEQDMFQLLDLWEKEDQEKFNTNFRDTAI